MWICTVTAALEDVTTTLSILRTLESFRDDCDSPPSHDTRHSPSGRSPAARPAEAHQEHRSSPRLLAPWFSQDNEQTEARAVELQNLALRQEVERLNEELGELRLLADTRVKLEADLKKARKENHDHRM
jgi:hypothetical protein